MRFELPDGEQQGARISAPSRLGFLIVIGSQPTVPNRVRGEHRWYAKDWDYRPSLPSNLQTTHATIIALFALISLDRLCYEGNHVLFEDIGSPPPLGESIWQCNWVPRCYEEKHQPKTRVAA